MIEPFYRLFLGTVHHVELSRIVRRSRELLAQGEKEASQPKSEEEEQDDGMQEEAPENSEGQEVKIPVSSGSVLERSKAGNLRRGSAASSSAIARRALRFGSTTLSGEAVSKLRASGAKI